MEFFDWSKGYVYLGSYVNIVSVYPEYDVLQSDCDPVDSMATISPGRNSARPPFLWLHQWDRKTASVAQEQVSSCGCY